jgi:hypothetical protein
MMAVEPAAIYCTSNGFPFASTNAFAEASHLQNIDPLATEIDVAKAGGPCATISALRVG